MTHFVQNATRGAWRQLHKHEHKKKSSCTPPLVPVVVLLAVDAAVLAEARELGLQVQLALAALEAAHVPLLVHGQKVVAVRDLPAAAGAQRDTLAAQTRHGLRVEWGWWWWWGGRDSDMTSALYGEQTAERFEMFEGPR